MDYDRKRTNEELGDEDITGRLTPTSTGKYKNGSYKNAFYVDGSVFFNPKEKDYKCEVITKVQGEENRRYRIFDRTMRFCIGALAIATSFLTITGAKITWDYYTKKDYNTRQIIEPFKNQFENEGRYEFVIPEDIQKKQEEQIRDMMDSQQILLEEGTTQGTTIENIIE